MTGAPFAGSSTASTPGADSFLSNWQAQLASLAGELDGSSEERERLEGTTASVLKEYAAGDATPSQGSRAGSALPFLAFSFSASSLLLRGTQQAGYPPGILATRNGEQTRRPDLAQGLEVTLANAKRAHPVFVAAEGHAARSKNSPVASPSRLQKLTEAVAASPSSAIPVPAFPVGIAAGILRKPGEFASSSAGSVGIVAPGVSIDPNGRVPVDGTGAAFAKQGWEEATSPAVSSPAFTQTSAVAARDIPAQIALDRLDGSHSPVSAVSDGGEPIPESGLIHAQDERPTQGISETRHPEMIPADVQSGNPVQQPNSVPIVGDLTGSPSAPIQMRPQNTAGRGITNASSSTLTSSDLQDLKRTARGVESAVGRNIPIQAQFATPPGEGSSIALDPAEVQTTANLITGNATAAAASPLRETFAALDAEPAPGSVTWTHAGAQHAEAGFEDSALGWVGVRAGLRGGAVHATLVPSSVEAAQALGLHMDGLNAYMAAQHNPVESLAIAAPKGRDADNNSEPSLSQNPNHGTGRHGNQGDGQHTDPQVWDEPAAGPALLKAGVDSTPAVGETSPGHDRAAQLPSGGGVHISVVA